MSTTKLLMSSLAGPLGCSRPRRGGICGASVTATDVVGGWAIRTPTRPQQGPAVATQSLTEVSR